MLTILIVVEEMGFLIYGFVYNIQQGYYTHVLGLEQLN